MTWAVANRLSIMDRSLLREGLMADVVVFDQSKVIDRATFEKPRQISAGVSYVVVNGTLVVDGGKHTGALPGRVLRGPGYKSTTSKLTQAVAAQDGVFGAKPIGFGVARMIAPLDVVII